MCWTLEGSNVGQQRASLSLKMDVDVEEEILGEEYIDYWKQVDLDTFYSVGVSVTDQAAG
jgi:hypothetical protein